MLTLELSSHLLEIPNDAFTTSSQFPMMLIQHSVYPDWLFNTQSRVLQTDWFKLEINERATLNINMPYLVAKTLHPAACHE